MESWPSLYDISRIASTTTVVSGTHDYSRIVPRMAKPKKNQSPRDRTPFNKRVREARGELTQAELGKIVGIGQQGVDKLENRPAAGSSHTVQIAKACGVSPYWLATGDGPKFIQHLPPEAAAIGAAWGAMPHGWAKDRIAHDLLATALPFLNAKHPLWKTADKLYRESLRRIDLKKELAGQEK